MLNVNTAARRLCCHQYTILYCCEPPCVAWRSGLVRRRRCCHATVKASLLHLTCSYCPAGEVPVCDTSNSRCVITNPSKHSGLFCTSDPTSATDCQRYKEFHALYERGVDQFVWDTATARRQANSVVFNTFIFMQVGSSMLLPLSKIASQAVNTLLSPAHSCLLLEVQVACAHLPL